MTAKKVGKVKLSKAARRPAKAGRGKPITIAAKKAKRKTQPKIAREGRRPPAALEVQLRKTVAELGLTEARKIFASVEAAFGQ
jgi:hypothetical protein